MTHAARRRRTALAVAAGLTASLARAQDATPPPGPPLPRLVAPPAAGEAPPGRRWLLRVGQASVFDTNVDQVPEARSDYATVLMGGAGWRNRLSRPSFEVSYEAAFHRYRESPRWDRVSHNAEATFEKRLSKRWSTETKGEMSLKGSSEDRELGNWYTLRQRANFRITPGLGFRLYGAVRLKRYPEPERDRDATNAYGGGELRLRLGVARLDLGSRRESNRARIPRADFVRWVHEAQIVAALGPRDDIGLGARFYDQRYPQRKIRVGSGREIRQDHRWISAVSWNHRLGDAVGVELAYTYTGRTSNDPDKVFGAHLFAVAFDYRFDRRHYRASEPSSPAGLSPIRPAGQEDVTPRLPAEVWAFASADEWDQKGISLLSSGSYAVAIHLYRQAVLRYPSLKARLQNLRTVYAQNGQYEVAYCLDPSDRALRRTWQQYGDKKEGLCSETR